LIKENRVETNWFLIYFQYYIFLRALTVGMQMTIFGSELYIPLNICGDEGRKYTSRTENPDYPRYC
jgi:hypothetical protein